MLQEPVIAAMFILGLIALGEVISIATKARIPMLFVALIGYLVLVWINVIPTNLIEVSGFVSVGTVLGTAPIIVHMGTLIPLESIKKQWKAAAISLIGIIFASILIIPVVTLLFDYQTAVAGSGPVAGGIIAVLVTGEGLKEMGLVALITIPTLILAVQSVFSMPIAINLLRRYGLKVRDSLDDGSFTNKQLAVTKEKEPKFLLPKKYRSNLILLFILFVGGAIAVGLGVITPIPYSLWSLVIGIVGRLLGIFPDRIMERSNAFSIGMAGIIFLIIMMMNDITFRTFISYLPEIFTIIFLGLIGIILGGYVGAKFFKWDPYKAIPVALTAMFGFPGDYIVCEEVSRSVGRNEEEEQRIFDDILTPMLVGGFTTVTVGSVVIATILVGTL
ncbi:hypothetical protein GLW20_19045 [Virgibacillus halodenitrificans]|nr:hypothetical protein [Virgibacillus halodenitrificans]